MNKKETLEIRKQFTNENCAITRICGCYVDAEKQIRTLASPEYTAPAGENGGFILRHSTGAYPFSSEVDVPLTYADYYYLEALTRIKRRLQP